MVELHEWPFQKCSVTWNRQVSENHLIPEELFWLFNLQYNSCFAAQWAFQFSTNNGKRPEPGNESERWVSSKEEFCRIIVRKKMIHIFHYVKFSWQKCRGFAISKYILGYILGLEFMTSSSPTVQHNMLWELCWFHLHFKKKLTIHHVSQRFTTITTALSLQRHRHKLHCLSLTMNGEKHNAHSWRTSSLLQV